jgi:hydrogenase maturation protein HypF
MPQPQFHTEELPVASPLRVLGCGAWLKNSACLVERTRVTWSPVHGDLDDARSRDALLRSLATLQTFADAPIDAVAHDLHPDFFSSLAARDLAQRLKIPAIAVQHHHAHIAQVAAQHGVETPVIGLALDGVGLGDDGNAWGGEMLWTHAGEFRRLAHLRALPMPGGDVAAREPWRMAAGLLHSSARKDEIGLRLHTMARSEAMVGAPIACALGTLTQLPLLLEKDLNCPRTSSAGRWFDAVAALLGICFVQTREAQAAQALEQLAREWLAEHPAPPIDNALRDDGLELRVLLQRILERLPPARSDMLPAQAVRGECAALFHVGLADALAHAAIQAAASLRLGTVVLGGGCFFNAVLRQRVTQALHTAGLEVLLAHAMNCGDAGLALGQAWVAANRLQQANPGYFATRSTSCV